MKHACLVELWVLAKLLAVQIVNSAHGRHVVGLQIGGAYDVGLVRCAQWTVD